MDTTDTAALDRGDMARLVGGQDRALDELMARHAQPLFRFLHRMLGNEDDANDLAQATFMRVYQHRADFRPDARFSTWLYTIAANLARNHHRWLARHPTVSLDTAPDPAGPTLADSLVATRRSPDDDAVAAECAIAVRTAVDQLPEDMREAVILCEWQEMPVIEAATVLGATPKAIESRLYRARQLLRERLKSWL
jgi:RNA polymerase sigma-70 factor (ECF subfamily)